jgi:hypothetical protein
VSWLDGLIARRSTPSADLSRCCVGVTAYALFVALLPWPSLLEALLLPYTRRVASLEGREDYRSPARDLPVSPHRGVPVDRLGLHSVAR